MRAILLGNKDLAVASLDVLARHEVTVAGVVLNPGDDGVEDGRWYRSLRRAATERGLDIIQPSNVSDDDGAAFIADRQPDLLLSVSYERIIRPRILELVPLAVNVHFSALPHCRGCLPLVHAMAGGDDAIGVTVHIMDAGIDTGDIIDQAFVAVSSTDTADSIYFACVERGLERLDRVVPTLVAGTYTRTPQQLERGSYHRQVYPSDRWITPGCTPQAFSCFVRAHTFPPYPTARVLVDDIEHAVVYRDEAFDIPTLGIERADAARVVAALNERNWQDACQVSPATS